MKQHKKFIAKENKKEKDFKLGKLSYSLK